MYLAYIDGSGRPVKDNQTNFFVLACLIAHEEQWQYIDNKVKAIKLKHFPRLSPEDIELHAKDMLNRDENVFKRLNWGEIYAIFDDVFDFLSDDETDICLIAIVIDKRKMYKGKDIEQWAYRLLVERINKFLEKNNEKLISAEYTPQYGIMIIDSCSYKADQKLRKTITEMLKEGTYYSDLKYLIEDPLFTDSKWRNLSQLVDCVAYAVRKKFRNSPNPSFHDAHWFSYYEKIFCKFDDDENGTVLGCGVKVFPQ